METIQRFKPMLLVLLAICLYYTPAEAQRRGRGGPRPERSCKPSLIPKGFVVIGYKPGICPAPITKRPENADIVCGAPLPAGFSFVTQVQGPLVPGGCTAGYLIADNGKSINNSVPTATEESCEAAERQAMDRLTARYKNGQSVSDLEVTNISAETYLCKERLRKAQ